MERPLFCRRATRLRRTLTASSAHTSSAASLPSFSDFFEAMMVVYGFHHLDFTPNAMACVAIFAHLCENFVGVAHNMDLFRHFFILQVEDRSHRSGNISWIPQGKKDNWD